MKSTPKIIWWTAGQGLLGYLHLPKNFLLSFHGVGASLGGLDPFNSEHLTALKHLIDRFNPHQVSEHATWSSFEGQYFADLLPLPSHQSSTRSYGQPYRRISKRNWAAYSH